MAWSPGTAIRTTLGYYVLHEGLIGVLGDQGLQEFTYANLAKEGPVSGADTVGKVWENAAGGFLGITDKYWAAAVIPDQTQTYQGIASRRARMGSARSIRRTSSAPRRRSQPGATTEMTQRLFAGAKEVTVVDRYQDTIQHQEFRSC